MNHALRRIVLASATATLLLMVIGAPKFALR